MNIILFPGSFDPIHQGHVNMAKIASESFDAEVIFIPSVISVWKNESTPFIHKAKMVELAIKNYPRFSMSDYENTLGEGVHYSIFTIRHFKSLYPNDKLYLLIGEDQVNEFHRWKEAKEISKLIQIIYCGRPGFVENDNKEVFHMVDIIAKDEIPVSSSGVRNMEGLEFINRDVLKYIEANNLYYMNKIYGYIKDHRFNHSISVANLAYDIALSNKIDNPIKAYVAGLLHDIGKEMPKEESEAIMKVIFNEYVDLPRFAYHQFVGSLIAKNDFNMDDEVVDAIRFHATGKANMSVLGRIIYAADKIEPTRGFDSSELINSCLKNYEQGFIDVLKANKEYLISKKGEGAVENPLTLECFHYYLDK